MNSGQETKSLKGILMVLVEKVIPLAKSKYDVVVFESISLLGYQVEKRIGNGRWRRGEQAAVSRIMDRVPDHFLNTVTVLAFITMEENTIQLIFLVVVINIIAR